MNTPKIINFPKIADNRGNLSFFEAPNQLPFELQRCYWIYDVPGGEIRGSHAFKEQQEVIVALSGSFDVVLHDGSREYKYSLNRSYFGLYVPRMYWRRLENFSTNALAFVAADTDFHAGDYLRDFDEFVALKKQQ